MTITEFLLARIAEDEARAPRKRGEYYGEPCPKCGRPAAGLGSAFDDEAVRVMHGDRDFGCQLTMTEWQEFMPDLGPSPSGARVLAECEAKRAIISWHDSREECCEERYGAMVFDPEPEMSASVDPFGNLVMRQSIGHQPVIGCVTLMALASVYADHEDFRDEWKP